MNLVEFIKQKTGITPPLDDKYGDWLGYEIVDVDASNHTVKTSLKIREEHLSPSNAVHGGVISGFLDFSLGCSIFSTLNKDQLCSTVNLNVKYFKPLKKGDEILAVAKLVHRGRSLGSVTANLYRNNDMDTIVAMATGTFNIYTP